MSLMLKPDELVTALHDLKHPRFPLYQTALQALCNLMGQEIQAALPDDVTSGECDNVDIGGMFTPIRPIDTNRPIPIPLQGLDDEGWE